MFEIEQFGKDFFKLPKPALIERWAGEYEAMIVHTRGILPSDLIERRRPYEDKRIQKYRKANYEPITKDPFNRALTNLQRIFSKAAVTITFKQEDLKNYLESHNFGGVSFDTYMNRVVLRRMIEDPNGFLVWWPTAVPAENERLEPQPMLVLGKQIRHINDEVFSFLSPEKSEVMVTSKTGNARRIRAMEGEVYYIITTNDYFKLVQYGDIEKRRFRIEPHYSHKLGRIPVLILGGEETGHINPRNGEEDVWLCSFFGPAVPYANEAIRQFSDHQGVMITSAFPIREMEPINCTNSKCKGGYISELDEDTRKTSRKECETCHGKGTIVPPSPYGTLLRPKRDDLGGDGSADPVPALRYISPDVEILKYSGEYWQTLVGKTEKALNLLFVEEPQSGVAKTIDREDKLSTLDRIGINVYQNLYHRSAVIVGQLRNLSTKDEDVVVALPPTFISKTEQDLLAEIDSYRKGSVNPMFTSMSMQQLVNKSFPGDVVAQRMIKVLTWYDPLFSYTTQEKMDMEAAGMIDVQTLRRSQFAYTALARLVEEKGADVLEKDRKTVEALVDEQVNAMGAIPEPPKVDPNAPPADPNTPPANGGQ
mgnify:CR=1 FL=1